jgi:hypothetical protein
MANVFTAVVVLLLLALPAGSGAQSICSSGHLATLRADGTLEAGSKDAVRAAFANGTPLRVGWSIDANNDGTADVSHWADAAFLSEFEGEIFAQLTDIQRQQPTRGQARIAMPPGRQRWSGLLGTNGMLESHFDDGSAAATMRVRSSWCVDPRAQSCAPEWRMVYRHDADGKPLAGDKRALLDAVRRGAAIRFAWGFSAKAGDKPISVEHAAEPVFLTIMEGEHVFVQLPEHIAQSSYFDPRAVRFDSPSVMWRGLMGSDGTFDAVYVDRATGKEVRRFPQRVGLAWFALLPPAGCAAAPPLELAVPGGVRAVPPPGK